MEYPEDLRYLDSHEYVRLVGEMATVGLSAFAVDELGDIVFVELPAVGDELTVQTSFGAVESVKAASDLYAPVSGTVVEVNEQLLDNPELLNSDPYGEAWLVKVQVKAGESLPQHTLSAQEYRAAVSGEA
ncbi:glycine cleavage system protein GcvH [Synechocystis sp. LKSZ1]|uniref:glycine cleavage system protein GcvH n=1 Tax=Synechocystis sp. LKSZ1 TaxID=3144951 RepID=UPI00336C25D4